MCQHYNILDVSGSQAQSLVLTCVHVRRLSRPLTLNPYVFIGQEQVLNPLTYVFTGQEMEQSKLTHSQKMETLRQTHNLQVRQLDHEASIQNTNMTAQAKLGKF